MSSQDGLRRTITCQRLAHIETREVFSLVAHFYPEKAQAAREAARIAERWYARLARLLDHQLSGRQTLVLYAAHPRFEQTNVVESLLGEGTGGVTESLKRRIVMPVGVSLADSDHLLGHELVHAFQYDILGPTLNLPLWFIEGMAEYFSIGSVDAQTAVWLRDAPLAEKLPDIDDLNDPRYFPAYDRALYTEEIFFATSTSRSVTFPPRS